MQSWKREVMKMFKAECEKIVKYDLQVSEDIIKFCQWVLADAQDETLPDTYDIIDFLDVIANKAPQYFVGDNEINIKYEK